MFRHVGWPNIPLRRALVNSLRLNEQAANTGKLERIGASDHSAGSRSDDRTQLRKFVGRQI